MFVYFGRYIILQPELTLNSQTIDLLLQFLGGTIVFVFLSWISETILTVKCDVVVGSKSGIAGDKLRDGRQALSLDASPITVLPILTSQFSALPCPLLFRAVSRQLALGAGLTMYSVFPHDQKEARSQEE